MKSNLNLHGKLIELVDYETIGIPVQAKSVNIGVKYIIEILLIGESAYLRHKINPTKCLRTSFVKDVIVEDNYLKIITQNTIYKFKILSNLD